MPRSSVDINSLSAKELRAAIKSAGHRHDDCASKAQLQQRAAEALAGGGGYIEDAVKGQTTNMLESELKEKKLELADVMEEEAEILALQRDGKDIRPGRIKELQEERIAIEEDIGKIQDALILQTDLDDLRVKLEQEQQKLEELEELKLTTTDGIILESQKRERILLENNIAKMQETIAAQVEVDDLELQVTEKLNELAEARHRESINEDPHHAGDLKRKTVRSEQDLQRAQDALMKAQEATVRETFAEWDNDGSGSISCSELKLIFKALGLAEGAIDKLFLSMDKNQDGEIDLQEFMNWTFNTK